MKLSRVYGQLERERERGPSSCDLPRSREAMVSMIHPGGGGLGTGDRGQKVTQTLLLKPFQSSVQRAQHTKAPYFEVSYSEPWRQAGRTGLALSRTSWVAHDRK